MIQQNNDPYQYKKRLLVVSVEYLHDLLDILAEYDIRSHCLEDDSGYTSKSYLRIIDGKTVISMYVIVKDVDWNYINLKLPIMDTRVK